MQVYTSKHNPKYKQSVIQTCHYNSAAPTATSLTRTPAFSGMCSRSKIGATLFTGIRMRTTSLRIGTRLRSAASGGRATYLPPCVTLQLVV